MTAPPLSRTTSASRDSSVTGSSNWMSTSRGGVVTRPPCAGEVATIQACARATIGMRSMSTATASARTPLPGDTVDHLEVLTALRIEVHLGGERNEKTDRHHRRRRGREAAALEDRPQLSDDEDERPDCDREEQHGEDGRFERVSDQRP